MIKVGFIGFGKFSQVRLRYLEKNPAVTFSGFFDPHLGDQNHGSILRYDCHEKLIQASDALIISVPPKLAPAYVVSALAQDKYVFCEKPAATSAHDLGAVGEVLSDSHMLAYGFNHRQHPSVRKMREVVQSAELGKILWMRGRYGKEVDDAYKSTWRCDPHLNGGGILIDQGIHLVDLMGYLAGGFDGAQAVLSSNYLNIDGVDDNGFVTLYSTSSKIAASLHSTVTQWRYLFSLEVFLERGAMVLNGLRTNSGNYGDEVLTIKPNIAYEPHLGVTEIRYPTNVSWESEVNAFIQSIIDGSAYPHAGYKDAMETTRLMDLIYEKAIWL